MHYTYLAAPEVGDRLQQTVVYENHHEIIVAKHALLAFSSCRSELDSIRTTDLAQDLSTLLSRAQRGYDPSESPFRDDDAARLDDALGAMARQPEGGLSSSQLHFRAAARYMIEHAESEAAWLAPVLAVA